MPPNAPRLRILSVGGNAVSAFLSWRLQATNACDVTLVWKSGYESVSQYGISFRSSIFGNERFKPRSVVRTPEEAAHVQKNGYDYVLVSIKALPDVYDLASVIEPVITPQHTCILINTSHSLGVESFIEKRFPKNVVLSLVSAAELSQHGPSEFEHEGKTDLWVGPANFNPEIPQTIQGDMSEALAMTLNSGQVNCNVTKNIQQQQFERMIGPIAFHTTSVLFEMPNHAELLELNGVRDLISDAIDELVQLADTRGCTFAPNFKEAIMEDMIVSSDAKSIMYQDYSARRPMEVETYLGAPIKIAKEAGIKLARIETLYALLAHVNVANQRRPSSIPAEAPPTPSSTAPRVNGAPPAARGPLMNGSVPPPTGGPTGGPMPMPPPMRGGRGGRAPSMTGPPPPMRRGPPPGMNGHHHPKGGPVPPRGFPAMQRRPSFENNTNGLDDFAHLMLYDSPDGAIEGGPGGYGGHPSSEFEMRERELMLRQKEIALRERELNMGRPARPRPPPSQLGDFDEEEGEDDYFDPMAYRGPPVDPDNVDMMSITSRRNRKQPSMSQMRSNPEGPMQPPHRRGNPFSRRNRQSTSRMMHEQPGLHDNILDNPLLGYSSDRYGALDRSNLGREGRESRSGSLTTSRLNELQHAPGGPGGSGGPGVPGAPGGYGPASRRTSQSPGGMPLSPGAPSMRGGHSPPYGPNGVHVNGRPSPPNMREPVPRYPPGHGNSVAPQQVENRAGVSNLYPMKNPPQVRSLTGSASASAGSGESGRSAQVSAENSAYSSQSSLGNRPPIGVR